MAKRNKNTSKIKTPAPKKSLPIITNDEPDLRMNQAIIVDFSFKGAFYSVKKSSFNNFLDGTDCFVEKFRECMGILSDCSEKTVSELYDSGNYRHCHKLDGQKQELAIKIIKQIGKRAEINQQYIEQAIGAEEIYQLGINGTTRLIGLLSGNVFRVFFVDYYHSLYPNEHKNTRSAKQGDFCAMSTKLYKN